MKQNRIWQPTGRVGRALTLVAMAMLSVLGSVTGAPQAAAAEPTTNGLFFGDGDSANYALYATSIYGSQLYYYVTPDWELNVALVVSPTINDNTFAPGPPADPYTQAAGFQSPRMANKIYDSEFAGFTLECGPNAWAWQQGYGGQTGGVTDYRIADWIADETVSGGSGAPPPGMASASSFMWNMNNYATRLGNGETVEWDMGNFTNDRLWRSPFEVANPDTPVGLDGYPSAAGPLGYSNTYQWEWPMVYEWSVDLSPICDDESLFVISGLSHHSPSKNGDENDEFPPGEEGDEALDFGDLPVGYGDASHTIIIAGDHLGTNPPDLETGTQSSDDALGDDGAAADDEDGIVFLTPLTPGTTAEIQITVSGDGYVSGFADFDNDGVLESITITEVDGAPVAGLLGDLFLAAGTHTVTIQVPADTTGPVYTRFRYTTASGQGGNSPTGTAPNGEVEDYALASIGNYLWDDLNGNGLQDDGTATGVNGVIVHLLDQNGDPVLDAAGNPITTSTADDSNGDPGYWQFPGLVPGVDYQVSFDAVPGYVFTTQDSDSGGTSGTQNSDVDSGGVSPTFALTPGQVETYLDAGLLDEDLVPGPVCGIVYDDEDASSGFDPGELGLGTVRVEIWQDADNNGSFETFVGYRETDANGDFDFGLVSPGSYRIVVDPSSVPIGYVPTTPNPIDFVMEPAGDHCGIEFGFAPSDVIGSWLWVIPMGLMVGALYVAYRPRRSVAVGIGA